MPLTITHPARGLADGLGDLLGDGDFIGGEIDVEGDQRLACADHRCPGGAQLRGSEIRRAGRIGLDLGFQSFILPLADVLQVLPIRSGGSFFI